MFPGGSLLLEGVGVASAYPKVLNDFKANIFKVDPLIVITSVTFPPYQVLAFASEGSSTKFEFPFDFPSSFCYFARLFPVTTWEVGRIILNVRFGLFDMEGIVD